MELVPFRDRLKQALTIRGMKQTKLVGKTGISKSMISEYLSGRYVPKQDNIYKIAKALNVSEAWLLGYDLVDMSRDTDSFFGVSISDDEHQAMVSMLASSIVEFQTREPSYTYEYRQINLKLKELNHDGLDRILTYIDDLSKIEAYSSKNEPDHVYKRLGDPDVQEYLSDPENKEE